MKRSSSQNVSEQMKQSRHVKSKLLISSHFPTCLSNASPFSFRDSWQSILAWGQFDPGVPNEISSELAARPGDRLPSPFSLWSWLLLHTEMPKSFQSCSNLPFSPYGMWGLCSILSWWQPNCCSEQAISGKYFLSALEKPIPLLRIVMGSDLVRILKCGLLKPTTPLLWKHFWEIQ